MIEILETITKLEKEKIFKDWKKNNKDYYLANAFIKTDKDEIDNIQIGYCNKKNDIVSFIVGKEISMFKDEVYKRPETDIKRLEKEKIKTDLKEALKKVKKLQEKIYSNEQINQKIIVLQNSDQGVQFNISLITASLNILNFRVSCEDGTLLKHEKSSLLQLGSNAK